jgi:hypothetical protein
LGDGHIPVNHLIQPLFSKSICKEEEARNGTSGIFSNLFTNHKGLGPFIMLKLALKTQGIADLEEEGKPL